MSFHRAKIFRRIGSSSFAVQLLQQDETKFMPGIIQVHCSDVDWGYLGGDCDRQLQLERRLCKMGTAVGVFSGMDEHEGIHLHEGVRIALGPYDAKLRAFVQCRLRVVDSDEEKHELGALHHEVCVVSVPTTTEEGSDSLARESPPRKREKRRAAFKWVDSSLV